MECKTQFWGQNKFTKYEKKNKQKRKRQNYLYDKLEKMNKCHNIKI